MKLSKKKLIGLYGPVAILAGVTILAGSFSFDYGKQNKTEKFVAGTYSYEEGVNAGVTTALVGDDTVKATLELGTRDMVAAEAPEEEPVQEQAPVQQPAAVADEWANRAMPKVQEYMNIRSEANAESASVGKLYKGAMAEVVEKVNAEWTKIKSGNVVGFAKNEFLAFGAEAKAIAEADCKVMATIQTDSLRIRKEAGDQAGVITLAEKGDRYVVLEDGAEWVKIQYKDKTGYVAKAYVTVALDLGKAISAEEEAEAIRKAEEEKARLEAEKKAAIAKSKVVETIQGAGIEASTDETILLAAVVQMEAGGQNYEGKLAVASVVMNRVNSSNYPNTITGVIYQKGQFPGAHNGILDRILAKGPRQDCIDIAVEALAGKNNAPGYHGFCSLKSNKYLKYPTYSIIGSHYFY